MRTRWLLSICVVIILGQQSNFCRSLAQALDGSEQKVAIIEFVDIPGRPPKEYDLKYIVELVGTQQKFQANATIGAGSTVAAMAASIDAMSGEFTGLQYKLSADKRSITIKGWKDPKTGKIYPVKRVTFTSKTMPKAVMPKVTNPKRPIA